MLAIELSSIASLKGFIKTSTRLLSKREIFAISLVTVSYAVTIRIAADGYFSII
jgi:hypothetical protein